MWPFIAPSKVILPMKLTLGCSLLFIALLFSSCANRDPRFNEETVYLGSGRTQPKENRANFDNVSYWDGDGVPGPAHIHISLGEQRAFFYKGGDLVGVSIISTGREGFNTPSGHFKISQKDKDHVSSRFGDYVDASGNIVQKEIDRDKDPMPKGARYDGARMPYFMRIAGGVGMHEGFLPGYPASHGCIRMPGFMAQAFFRNVQVGTPVEVTP
jgi:lipoprotein-anchoring transpeptidase ErfK/SrfK